jgi:hypothetical protein
MTADYTEQMRWYNKNRYFLLLPVSVLLFQYLLLLPLSAMLHIELRVL